MKLKDRFLRYPLAPEVLALLEKIDSIESFYDTSYYPVKELVNDGGFSVYERWMLKRALSRISRRHAYSAAMHVIVKNELPKHPRRDMVADMSQLQKRAFMTQQAAAMRGGAIGPTTTAAQGQQAMNSLTPYDIYKNLPQ